MLGVFRLSRSADIGLIGLAVMGQNLILNMNGTFLTFSSKRQGCNAFVALAV